jgi:hypothetical protein
MVGRLVGQQDMRSDRTRVVDGVVFLHTMQRSGK